MNVRHVPVQSYTLGTSVESKDQVYSQISRPNISHTPLHYWDTSCLTKHATELRESAEGLVPPNESEKLMVWTVSFNSNSL
jgi:hypothetical protein